MEPTWSTVIVFTGIALSLGSSLSFWFGYRVGERRGILYGRISFLLDHWEKIVENREVGESACEQRLDGATCGPDS
jgi:membrane protein DedA with SNARE-associated domain